ncbi:MAG: glutaminyl-tRNA synthase (glutamine-hydrolyzing) subunit B, partial [Candidatus Lloydbacteria bacterium RIFCSPHIGHO2_02_FULL_51_22]
TIGLEIHAELNTRTKMFCDSKNDPDETRPNVNICPVCTAHPGTLPVINKEAVRHVLRVGKALGGTIADFTEFDRKNYFYPDIPKGYQISQYEYPLVKGGYLQIPIFGEQTENKNSKFQILPMAKPSRILGTVGTNSNKIEITRVHLEEDTARSIHGDKGQGTRDKECSLVDFNRAGVPLMELVTEPVITSAKQAGDFARELQLLVRYLGASEANMEKGQMRVEANVSVSKDTTRGTKVEIKNLNSFRVVERAIAYEIARQSEVLEGGGHVVQETRGWDEGKQETFSQRMKESAADYRYFPDPDLPKLKISEIEEFKNIELPELPWEKRTRYKKDYGIKDEDIEVFVADDTLGIFFENVVAAQRGDVAKAKIAANYITSDVQGLRAKTRATFMMSPEAFAELVGMVMAGEISSRGAKDILALMYTLGDAPRALAEKHGLLQKSDRGELAAIVDAVIAKNAQAVEEYKNGKDASLQFLIGQGMRESRGSANPGVLGKLLKERLGR